MIIGLTGPRYSGKTEVVKILKTEGFNVLGFGDEVRLECAARGLPLNTDLHEFGVDGRKKYGELYWGRRVEGRITDKSFDRKYVLDGMRSLGDFEVFQKYVDFILVGVDAPMKVRWERCRANRRGRSDDVANYDDFVRRCERDESSSKGGLQSAALFEKRQYRVMNDSDDLDILRLKVSGLLAQLIDEI